MRLTTGARQWPGFGDPPSGEEAHRPGDVRSTTPWRLSRRGGLAAALGAELAAGIAPLAPPEPSLNGATGTETVLRQADEQKLVDQIVSERLEELVEGFSAECARAR